jgi:hypothetical protein
LQIQTKAFLPDDEKFINNEKIKVLLTTPESLIQEKTIEQINQ